MVFISNVKCLVFKYMSAFIPTLVLVEVFLQVAEVLATRARGTYSITRYLLEHVLIEVFLQVAEVLADHLLAQTLARDEELGDGARAEVDESVLHQVADTFLWLPVSQHNKQNACKTG